MWDARTFSITAETTVATRRDLQGGGKSERQSKVYLEAMNAVVSSFLNDDDDVYYPKGRRPREDEEGEESYEKQRQRPGRGG